MKLNVGCGKNKKEGYINIDKMKTVNPDLLWDLEVTPLPFGDNSIDEIYTSHTLEHIENLIPLMNDFYRVLKPGGQLFIIVPRFPSELSAQDPTHVRFFTEATFGYFYSPSRDYDYGIKLWDMKYVNTVGDELQALLVKS